MKRRISAAQRRKRKLDLMGSALIVAVALAFAGVLTGAYLIDKANGISVGQSLANHGL